MKLMRLYSAAILLLLTSLPGAAHAAGGASGRPAPPLFPAPKVDMPEAEIVLSASPGGKASVLDAPLRLTVDSPRPGWILSVRASELRHEDGEALLPAASVRLVGGGKDVLPLDEFKPMVLGGPSGRKEVPLELEALAAEDARPGRYSGEMTFMTQAAPQGEARTVTCPIAVVVEIRITYSVTNQKTYFHFGDPSVSQSAVIEGSLQADAPIAFTLVSTRGPADRLPMLQRMGDAQAPDETKHCIPVAWRLSDSPGDPARPPDDVRDRRRRLSWDVQTSPGTTLRYRLECEVTPAAHQPPGDYAKRFCIEMRPLL